MFEISLPLRMEMKKYLNYIFDITLIYYCAFVLLLWLSYGGIPNYLHIREGAMYLIFTFLGGGFFLFWIYIVVIFLRLIKEIKIEKKRFITLIILVLVNSVYYFITPLE
jgi:hypothetical protein